jgi:hypothetical protein
VLGCRTWREKRERYHDRFNYFSVNKQYFSHTTNQRKHQHKSNFNISEQKISKEKNEEKEKKKKEKIEGYYEHFTNLHTSRSCFYRTVHPAELLFTPKSRKVDSPVKLSYTKRL